MVWMEVMWAIAWEYLKGLEIYFTEHWRKINLDSVWYSEDSYHSGAKGLDVSPEQRLELGHHLSSLWTEMKRNVFIEDCITLEISVSLDSINCLKVKVPRW